MTLWFCHQNHSGYDKGKLRRIDLDQNPSPAVMAVGINGDNTSHYWIEDDGKACSVTVDKPPYHVPLMKEIRHLPSNGFKVISTFAGGGGSSTGYRMAGFDVIWANEFLPAAQATYAANHPDTILDGRSIHDLTADDILTATGLKAGELDLFDGSPPCQSFSMAGKREKKWGVESDYGDGLKQRNDDLFFEYTRLLRGLQPKVFVAENVSGLVKGVAKGYFKIILRALRGCGYTVEAKLLDAQWLGVPQARQRIIFIGVRSDLDVLPAFPVPLPYRYSVRDAIGGHILTHQGNNSYQLTDLDSDTVPSPAIMTAAGKSSGYDVAALEGANGFNGHAYKSVDTPAATVQAGRPLRVIHDSGGWHHNQDMTGRPCKTVSASRISFKIEGDLMLPPSRDRAYDGENTYGFQRCRSESPSPTVTIGSPGNDMGHPTERRKLTIAELKRICSFPDDYILTGSYADQWERCGNSVPPVMMASIAAVVRDQILALI